MPKNVFISADASTIEMRTLAQGNIWLQGYSRMAEVLREGKDLHVALAAQLLGLTYEETKARIKAGDNEAEDARQLAKVANFGYPGGCSPATFMNYAEGFGHKVTLEKAKESHARFFDTWTEMRGYFDHVRQVSDLGTLVQLKSGRVRGGVSYCSAANSYFQGLAADACKAALWEVSKECYTAKDSPLYGTRPVIFMHDEIIAETSFDPANLRKSHDAAMRLSYVMRTAMEKWIPDIPIICEPVMTRRLYKGAKPVFRNGLLVPCKPRKEGKRTLWESDL
jgi:DNA polymerase-1